MCIVSIAQKHQNHNNYKGTFRIIPAQNSSIVALQWSTNICWATRSMVWRTVCWLPKSCRPSSHSLSFPASLSNRYNFELSLSEAVLWVWLLESVFQLCHNHYFIIDRMHAFHLNQMFVGKAYKMNYDSKLSRQSNKATFQWYRAGQIKMLLRKCYFINVGK